MRARCCVAMLALLCAAALALPSHASGQKKESKKTTVAGYVERVAIPRVDSTFKAKLDTGALTSSVHADIISLVEPKQAEDGKGYVVFTLKTDEGVSNHIKKPLTRMVRIKDKAGGFHRRPVVEMTFCIAGVLLHDEVNLSNREDFNYEVLVGRNMLINGGFIVDPARVFVTKPNCPEPEQEKNSGESASLEE